MSDEGRTTITALNGQPVEYPARLLTIAQLESAHPGFKGRIRGFIVRADWGQAGFAELRDAVVRIGRSVYIDEPRFLAFLRSRRAAPPDPPRNPHGRAGRGTK